MTAKADGLAQKLKQQINESGLDNPLGKDLGVTNENLASFSTYSTEPSPGDFLSYLNRLKKQTAIKGWPRVFDDDDETQLTGKFQQVYDLCLDKNPDARASLTVGNTNYFFAVWQKLKDIDKIRQENQRAQDDIDKLQGRLRDVPDLLDKASYVGLFIIDPSRQGLEMIRFEGP